MSTHYISEGRTRFLFSHLQPTTQLYYCSKNNKITNTLVRVTIALDYDNCIDYSVDFDFVSDDCRCSFNGISTVGCRGSLSANISIIHTYKLRTDLTEQCVSLKSVCLCYNTFMHLYVTINYTCTHTVVFTCI